MHASFKNFDAALVLNVANGYFLPLLTARGIPTVLNTDGLEWQRGKWGTIARKVFYQGARLSARHATVLVSDSQAIADIWAAEFGVRPRYIPYGAPVEHDLPTHRIAELGLQPRSYALAVARLIPENNVGLTLDALHLLGERLPAVVVGSSNYRSDLETRLHQLARKGRVLWLGHVHDQELLTQLWSHCGVYIHGHSVGGTNPSLLQALGAGAPVLALDTPYNREVVRHTDQFYRSSATDLATRIARVIDDPVTQALLAERGRSTVAARFQWTAVCDAYERALCDAQAQSGREAIS